MSKEQVKKEIQEIIKECGIEGWDGYGAEPVTQDAINEALTLLEALPADIQFEEGSIGAIPRGKITFEWRNKNCIFSMELDDGFIIYAGLFPDIKDGVYGQIPFNGTVPEEILNYIRRCKNELI
jgi:hypothetical protein